MAEQSFIEGQLPTSRHMWIWLLILVSAAFILGSRNFINLHDVSESVQDNYEKTLLPITYLQDADSRLFEIELGLKRSIIAQTIGQRADARKRIAQAESALEQDISLAKQGISHYENRQRLSSFESLYTDYRKNVERALDMLDRYGTSNQNVAALVLSDDFQSVVRSADRMLDEIVTSKKQTAKESSERLQTLRTQIQLLALLILASMAGIVVTLFMLFRASIVKPFRQMKTSLDDLSSGRFDIDIPLTGERGFIGDMARSIERIQTTVKQLEAKANAHASISHALLEDIEPVIQLIVENANQAAFDSAAMTVKRQQELSNNFKHILGAGVGKRMTWEGKTVVVPEELWVYKLANEVVAFALILGIDATGKLERELNGLAVHPSFQRQGIGTEVFNFFCRQFAGRDLYIQTKPGSWMMRMATNKGFSPCRKVGPDVLLKRPADFGRLQAAA